MFKKNLFRSQKRFYFNPFQLTYLPRRIGVGTTMQFTLGCQGFIGPNPSTFRNKFNNYKNAAQRKLDNTSIAINKKKTCSAMYNLKDYKLPLGINFNYFCDPNSWPRSSMDRIGVS